MNERCGLHSSFEADYCPSCGTARPVGMTTEEVLAYAERVAPTWGIGDEFYVVDESPVDEIRTVADVIDPDDDGGVTILDSDGFLYGASRLVKIEEPTP